MTFKICTLTVVAVIVLIRVACQATKSGWFSESGDLSVSRRISSTEAEQAKALSAIFCFVCFSTVQVN